MRRMVKSKWISPAWRWMAVMGLGLALIGGQVASASTTGSATIMVLAPGAPQGAVVNVEWFDPLTNLWEPVRGWTGTLNQATVSATPFQAFAVLPENYGEGAFRWVIYNPGSPLAQTANPTMGGASSSNASSSNASSANASPAVGSLWGVSTPFTLPNTDGDSLQMTVAPLLQIQQTNTVLGANTAAGASVTANTVVNMSNSTIMSPLDCPTTCNASAITAKFTGLPLSSWITVQWLDGNGSWHPVVGWQGYADFVDASGKLVKQFGVYQANYGQGPFRLAVYNAPNGGSLLAISANFSLPSESGQNEILNLAG